MFELALFHANHDHRERQVVENLRRRQIQKAAIATATSARDGAPSASTPRRSGDRLRLAGQ